MGSASRPLPRVTDVAGLGGPSADTIAASGAASSTLADRRDASRAGATMPTTRDHQARCDAGPDAPPSIRQRQLSS